MSKRIFLIAGEYSGDALGGPLMAAMRAQDSGVELMGVGGPLMAAQGLSSFVPMDELCVMGVFEVLKHYPRLRRLGYQIVKEIEQLQPDVVVTIDLPDFNFAVTKLLKKRGVFQGKIVHYVAPTVWAWRPGRAKKIARFLDGLMCLFPFEPEYFTTHGLRAEFVGHSLVESGMERADGARFRAAHGIDGEARTLGLFFGSRVREVEAHGAVFRDVIKGLDDVHVIVPTLPRLAHLVASYLKDAGVDYTLVSDAAQKLDAMAACDAALAVSGTIGLELAYMGVPHVITYRAHPLTAFIIRMVVKTKYAHLANILLDRLVVPEFLQGDCTADKIGAAVDNILYDPNPQKDGFHEVGGMLVAADGLAPSARAAGFVLS